MNNDSVVDQKIMLLNRISDRFVYVAFNRREQKDYYFIEDVISPGIGKEPFVLKLSPVNKGIVHALTSALLYFTFVVAHSYLNSELPKHMKP